MNEELLTRIDALAAKLNTTGEKLWAVLLKQVQVELWITLIWIAITLAIIVGAWRAFKFCKEESDDFEFGGDGYALAGFFLALFAFIDGMVLLGNVLRLPTLLINPEYAAIKLLILGQ